MTFADASDIISAVDRLQHLTQAFREHSPTVRGQLTGIAMIVMPALAHPLPLAGVAKTTVQVVAVIVGSLGSVVVFGGMIQRVVLQTAGPSQPPDSPAEPGTLDDVLRSLPRPRTAWVGLLLLCLGFAGGAAWCLRLAFTHGWDEHLADVLILGLPATALGWAAWRARVMLKRRRSPGPSSTMPG